MPKPSVFPTDPQAYPLEGAKAWWPFGVLSLLLLGADQGSKAWAEAHLALNQAGPWLVQAAGGGLRLKLAHPVAAKLGPLTLHPDTAGWLSLMLGLAAVALALGRSRGSAIRLLGLAGVAGGGLGLAGDRLRLGHAVGWVSLPPWFPTPFALAELGLLAGLLLLVLDGLLLPPLGLRKSR